ncbi:MAG: SprT-like domain-containing protein [Candidatus Woesearchaeota archaeon]
MNLIEKAYQELFPGKTLFYNTKLIYSGRFKAYNANASRSITTLTIKLAKEWKKISEDIQMGLIQSMLVKIFKTKERTFNMDLYTNFVKHIHITIPKTKSDPDLEASFNRMNEKYFYSLIEQPNLRWGSASVRKLGSYNYQTDEISISSIFQDKSDLLDYVMYHEMLHKKHKFYSTKTGRSYHHTAKFKKDEKAFENSRQIEKELTKICRKQRIKRAFFPYSFK